MTTLPVYYLTKVRSCQGLNEKAFDRWQGSTAHEKRQKTNLRKKPDRTVSRELDTRFEGRWNFLNAYDVCSGDIPQYIHHSIRTFDLGVRAYS